MGERDRRADIVADTQLCARARQSIIGIGL